MCARACLCSWRAKVRDTERLIEYPALLLLLLLLLCGRVVVVVVVFVCLCVYALTVFIRRRLQNLEAKRTKGRDRERLIEYPALLLSLLLCGRVAAAAVVVVLVC